MNSRQLGHHNVLMGVVERRGGTLLSDYVRSDEKVTIQCENNHEFEMTPSDVKRGRRGRWCPKCSGCCPIQAEERLKTVILERGGTLLSNYVKSLEKVTIQCENDHQFKMTPSSVKSKQWCPKCSGQCPIQAEERLKAVILERGGILLSDYVKDNEKVTIQCENNHEFKMTPHNVKSWHWCPKCSGHCPIQAEEKLKTVILERGGNLLSDYVKGKEKVTIQCENGHEFMMPPSDVKSGCWCPKCSGRCPIQAEEKLKTVILERGGILLSDYVKNNEKVTIQCENNHKFEMIPNNVKSGQWCPKCSGHCPIQAEERLNTVILERGGTLLSDYVKNNEKVTIQCENGHEFKITPSSVKSGCWCPKCSGKCPIQAEERLKAVILERGGTLLSDYVKNNEKVTIQCEKGHKFDMTPNSVKRGQWCPKCSGKCPIQAEERLKTVILERGGTLLSNYVKSLEKVTIQCENDHEFKMAPSSVKSGQWCPKCSGCCPIQAEERLKAVILERGGILLSN